MTSHPVALALLAAASLAACSSHDSSIVLPSFRDVSEAPTTIQTAARAVVRIQTGGASATGAFISPTGMLITNNHVLGVDVCPIEGCYAQITFMHQRHAKVRDPETVFVVPMAVDVGLDMAAVQVSMGPGQANLDTPDYVTLTSRDPASLQGMNVHVVGHPEGDLKKWTQGKVVDSDGTWIVLTAYILPGNSGSPVLDDGGHMVGILHRGPTQQDLVTNRGIDEYAIGTTSSALITALTTPLPPAIRSILADASTDDDVAKHQALYLNAHMPNAIVNGAPKAVLASLAVQCDAGLARQDFASPDDLSTALAPCQQAESWIECRTDARPGVFRVCPPVAQDVTAWLQRFQSVYDRWLAFNGELALDMVSFAPAALASTQAQGLTAGAQALVSALSTASPGLDFRIADYLAAFNVDSYAGTNILDFLRRYTTRSGYALSGTLIASTALWLNDHGKLTLDDTKSFLQTLAADDQVVLGTKLYVEDVLYVLGALD